ncbi:MAG: General transcription factor IIH subunit 1, partial [Paramarteilia canceri]
RISPDNKAKVQLQIIDLDGKTFTFHFNNEAGRNCQFRDRDIVKNAIQSFLIEKNKKLAREEKLKTK